MDINETRVKQWLHDQGCTNIQYEPEGNDKFPDFAVNNSIAVEVRRLNWMFGDKNTGLESVEKPLERNISAGLSAAQSPPPGYRVYVFCDFLYTELPDKHMVIEEVKEAANHFINRLKTSIHHGQPLKHSRDETDFGLIIHFITGINSATNKSELMSVTAGIEKTGFVMGDSIDTINRSINEKTGKITDKHDHYTEFWLVLVEHNVNPTILSEPELQAVRNGLTDTSPWSRIIILSGLEGVSHLDLI